LNHPAVDPQDEPTTKFFVSLGRRAIRFSQNAKLCMLFQVLPPKSPKNTLSINVVHLLFFAVCRLDMQLVYNILAGHLFWFHL